MSLPVPDLDDLDFDRLVKDARSFIPRYAPEWTDHNIHDPGITLLELVAWLVDQEIYQVGFVGDRHIAAFAALLGVRPQPATAARGLIWPFEDALSDDIATTGTDLDEGTKIACVEQPDVPFELDAAVHVTPARLADTPAQDTAERFEITAQSRSRRAALSITETGDAPGSVEVVFDRPLVERAPDEPAHPVALGVDLDTDLGDKTPPEALRGRLVADYRLEGDGAPWRRVEIVTDGSHALNRTGTVLLRIPPEPHVAGPQKTRSRLRLRTRRRVNPIPPRIRHVALNVLPGVQRETRKIAVLDRRSDGLPNQSFALILTGLMARDDMRIEVEEDGALRPWQAVEDLSKAGPQDAVYELHPIDDEIVFGNGVNGRIPPRDAQIRHLDYPLTRGAAGNLTAGLNWTVQGAPMRGGQTAYGTSHVLLTGGADAWDMKRLRAAARARALERRALLTNSDLADAARALDGMAVARADVRIGFHPTLPHHAVPGARALIVTPARPADLDPLTRVPPRYVAAVERALRPRRVLGERLTVLAAARVPVSVAAELLIVDGHDDADVIETATARINARLSDVAVPAQADIEPWPVGRPVTRKEIKALLAGVSGVIAVPSCRLARGDDDPGDHDLVLAPDEIAIGHEHRIDGRSIRERRS